MSRSATPDLGLGLAVPIVTALDARGRLAAADQRALVAHVLAGGRGAGIVFVMGTTGEWNGVDAETRHAAIRVSVDAVAEANAARPAAPPARAWAGVTAPDAAGTLACLEVALASGADAVVVAPLAIAGLADPLAFVADMVAPRLRDHPGVPLYVYDNAEIAVDPSRRLLDAPSLARLSRLDCVRGIKISAPRPDVEAAMAALAAAQGRDDGFEVYIGHASMIFDVVRSTGPLRDGLGDAGAAVRLAGLVPGAGNVLPRAWRLAWEACWAGDAALMDGVHALLDAFRAESFVGDRRPIVATLKRALLLDGVLGEPNVAPATDRLSAAEAAAFDRSHAALAERLGELAAAIPGLGSGA